MKPVNIIFLLLSVHTLQAQQKDSIPTAVLEAVKVKSLYGPVDRLPEVSGTYIWSGKKNEVLRMDAMDASISDKIPRQVFSKVPGVFVYDMDGSGNQVNIAVRGLDPHRGWEFNIRKNGIITNSDMYGYPASHYSLPFEAVERIELVRGSGALQYGAQFGGMLNYITRSPDTTRKLGFESVNTAGSYGLLSTYNAVGGRLGKIDYYAYFSLRTSTGYRDNSHTDYNAAAVMLRYHISKRVELTAEFAHSAYLYRMPGQLTDSMFNSDPRQSTRSRNYFNPDIYVPSLQLQWGISAHTTLSATVSALLGARNSVMYDKPATVEDSINPATLQYNNRQVDIDQFHSFTAEVNVLHRYTLLSKQHLVKAGVQVFDNNLHRRQLGVGTTGTDFDLSISGSGWGRDLNFITGNIAVFAENRFEITNKLSLTPGLRWEHGHSDMSGNIQYYSDTALPNTISHDFVLLGVNLQYNISRFANVYAGITQAYRPVIFKDIIPASAYEVIDKNLQDATGYNAEAGFRGSYNGLQWDAGFFYMSYNNRMGTLSIENDQGGFYQYKTNTGNAVNYGMELYAGYGFRVNKKLNLNLFTSTAWMNAHYTNAMVKSGNSNIDIDGNSVESAPKLITRNGITAKWQKFSMTLLCSYTSETFADALNTTTPSATGSVGLVPAYTIIDVNSSIRINKTINMRLNINNLFNQQYFTKRPSMYPGPGIWPSDGINANLSIGIQL